MATKKQFLEEYRAQLLATYGWAREHPDKLERFMASAKATIANEPSRFINTWNRSGEAFENALVKCGLSKRITPKALRELPEE